MSLSFYINMIEPSYTLSQPGGKENPEPRNRESIIYYIIKFEVNVCFDWPNGVRRVPWSKLNMPYHKNSSDPSDRKSRNLTYPVAWRAERQSAFPEPVGMTPRGIFIAVSQSGRFIRPLIT